VNSFTENVGIQAIVIPELELSHIEREVFAADFMVAAHHAALNQVPKALNRVRVDRTRFTR
jgi:hypothetical protein